MKKWEKFSREELEQIVKSSSSKKEIAEKIGYSVRGDYAQKIDKMVAFYNFSIEHLHGNLNLVGQRFGLLEVVGMAPTKNGRKMWYCNCDCGTQNIIVQQNNLRSGNTRSCGCQGRKTIKNTQRKDLTDTMIGFWHVIKPDENKSKNGTYWFCQCTLCNNPTIHSISAANLLSGKSLSCGCHKSSIKTIAIEAFLEDKNYCYKKEFSFPDLKSDKGVALRFDYALFSENRLVGLIEYQGKQHYCPNYSWGGETEYKIQVENDLKKQQYCFSHNIPFYAIPYWLKEEEIKHYLGGWLCDIYGVKKQVRSIHCTYSTKGDQ